MENVSSVRPTGKFPEKVENLKKLARFPGWNFRTEFRVPFTRFSYFIPVSIVRLGSHLGVPSGITCSVPYCDVRSNGTAFYLSEYPFLFPPKFLDFFI